MYKRFMTERDATDFQKEERKMRGALEMAAKL